MEEFIAKWRNSAHEAVPYTEDFPECLLVLPELTDGAIGQGKATRVIIHITLEEKGKLVVSDNGKGISDVNRLLSWESEKSCDVHHRYGHGSKKCLTKWNKNHSAKWNVMYRAMDKRGKSGSLFVYNGPFQGNKKLPEEDEKDDVTLYPSGTKWEIEFDRCILGDINTKDKLFNAIKEILRTRYVKEYFDKTEFILTVNDRTESSCEHNWKTFEECLQEEVKEERAKIAIKESIPFNNGMMHYTQYRLTINGNRSYKLKEQFPLYGAKNMAAARLHISISGRIIEIPHIYKFYKRTAPHNDYNGFIGIVTFTPNDPNNYEQMPTPCTTKVSFYPNCPNYIRFVEIMNEIHTQKKKVEPQPQPQPQPQPVLQEKEKEQEQKQKQESESESEEQKQDYIVVPKNKKVAKSQKELVWNTHIGDDILKHKCLCCKHRYIQINKFEAGHVKSRANGGEDSIDNLRPICVECNRSMGSMHMEEFIKHNAYWF